MDDWGQCAFHEMEEYYFSAVVHVPTFASDREKNSSDTVDDELTGDSSDGGENENPLE